MKLNETQKILEQPQVDQMWKWIIEINSYIQIDWAFSSFIYFPQHKWNQETFEKIFVTYIFKTKLWMCVYVYVQLRVCMCARTRSRVCVCVIYQIKRYKIKLHFSEMASGNTTHHL